MAFLNNQSTDLSRYSIGEIAGLSGVPNFYNAGSSKWLRSGVSTASSNLTTTTKTNLAAAGTASAPTVLVQSALSFAYNSNGPYATYPIARISASSVSVVPAMTSASPSVTIGTMTAAGFQIVPTGQTSMRNSSGTGGANGVVAGNNTKIFSYTFTGANALSVKSTTNGTTWTTETVTGLPTSPIFTVASTTIAHASQTDSGVVAGTLGWQRKLNAPSQFAVFWCGARFLLLAPSSPDYLVSLSADGFTFTGDNTVAVLGTAITAMTGAIQFYRNGNNCYLHIANTVMRYSTDGGITWANSTFAAAPSANTFYLQYNATDPAKLIIVPSTSSSAAYYTADSGATWSASRTLPSTNSNGGLYYRGSTVVHSTADGTYRVSTDDGVTYVQPTFPVGVLSTSLQFFADANRFYATIVSQNQLLTSSDAVTWTIVTLPTTTALGTTSTAMGNGIVSFDSNTVALIGYNQDSGYSQCILTNDGGVTWTMGQYTVDNTGGTWNVGNAFTTPDGGGVGFAYGATNLLSANCTNVLKADITGGGAFYRTGATAITPIQANSFAYVRVG
jgi:hypothetical protein